MVRIGHGLVAILGLAAALSNKRFARASTASSKEFFGRDVREGSREHKAMQVWSRTIAILVGTVMFVAGVLGVFGISWQE
jgi:hypothetical protein